MHTLPLDDKEVFIFTSLLNVLFKTNLFKEKGWDSKFCYNTFIFYDNIDKFHFMTTFVFVNHNKEDWGLTDSRTIKSYNVY